MTSTSYIQEAVKDIPDPSVRGACLRLVEQLTRHLDHRATIWTYAALANLAGTSPDDQVFRLGVQVLSSRPSAKMLDMHYMYFDPRREDPEGEYISDSEVALAYTTGYLVDPQDGAEITDFEKTLAPYFQISSGVER